jgi:ParB/RepB/Spo0J family partition protein
MSELREVMVDQIRQSDSPVRRQMGDLAALAESMQDYGLQQPIAVRLEGNQLVLTSGLRRVAAARLLGWTTIPAFVRSVGSDEAYLLDLIENLQRQDLAPEEEADALGELIRTRGWTLQELAHGVKRSVAYVSKRVRVFEDPQLRDAIAARGLPVSTAEELLAASGSVRAKLIERAVVQRWDQARARHEIARLRHGATVGPADSSARREGTDSRRGSAREQHGARPSGLTRAIREFKALLGAVQAADLTPADRAALRALYRDLVMIARAPVTPQRQVFPALPTTTAPVARRAGRGKSSRAVG